MELHAFPCLPLSPVTRYALSVSHFSHFLRSFKYQGAFYDPELDSRPPKLNGILALQNQEQKAFVLISWEIYPVLCIFRPFLCCVTASCGLDRAFVSLCLEVYERNGELANNAL